MNPALAGRLAEARERFEELERLLAEPELAGDPKRFAALSREYAELETITRAWARLESTRKRIEEARQLAEDRDDDLRAMAREELAALEPQLEHAEHELQALILPRDPNDDRSLYLEIRAGTGGQEAALFAGDLFRMYSRYAERQGWPVEVLSTAAGEVGGWRELIARIDGRGAYSRLKFESGTHRVQRVPATESQGRIHTSACTVAILPEAEDVDEITIDPNDLRIDTFRSSGAGGQHVNTTDSAIRITHLPSGIVVECQDERSQHKNKARALSLLSARLLEAEQRRVTRERAADRKLQVGSGDRSERIRTYNFPQGRVTDHRVGLTLYDLDGILEGELDALIGPLTEAHQAELLAELAGHNH
ncbi:MAG: peptide chain release factor 1 [Wenzhouxiangellaceae bacterium]|nr:peptide chain release factor 1 [Wenzhouxiangellaceae bacterium]